MQLATGAATELLRFVTRLTCGGYMYCYGFAPLRFRGDSDGLRADGQTKILTKSCMTA